MYARMMTYTVHEGRIDEYLRHSRERTRPAARKLKGWKGVLVLVDPKSHKTQAISLWETEADMQAALENNEFAPTLPGHAFARDGFTSESYEVGDFELYP
jgi:heme-degrading monooxygenase HmoA